MRRVIELALSDLYPGYFPFILATGIISIAAYLLEMESLAWLLFEINKVAHRVFWLFMLVRLFRNLTRLTSDLTDHVLNLDTLHSLQEFAFWGVSLLSFQEIW